MKKKKPSKLTINSNSKSKSIFYFTNLQLEIEIEQNFLNPSLDQLNFFYQKLFQYVLGKIIRLM